MTTGHLIEENHFPRWNNLIEGLISDPRINGMSFHGFTFGRLINSLEGTATWGWPSPAQFNIIKPTHALSSTTAGQGTRKILAHNMATFLGKVVQPQKSKLCDSLGGPPVTAQRIRLKDGRWLAYSETGVPRDKAKFKIILAHGFTGSRLDLLRASPVTFPF